MKLTYIAASNQRPAPYQDEEVCITEWDKMTREWKATDKSIITPMPEISKFKEIVAKEMPTARVFRVSPV
jgi:hypothetical protein